MQPVSKELISQIFNTKENVVLCNTPTLKEIYHGQFLDSFTPISSEPVVQHIGIGTYKGEEVQVYLVNGLESNKCVLMRNADK